MPSLVLVKWPGKSPPVGEIELTGEPQLIGRLAPAGCQIELNHKMVSKQHARITAEKGRFFVEDVGSHNGTYLNGTRLATGTLTPLNPGDKIGICDFVFVFCEGDDIPTGPVELARDARVPPPERLRALLSLGADPARAGDLGPLLDQVAATLFSGDLPPLTQVADTLFGMFAQADRCFVLLLDEAGRPVPKAVRHRRVPEDARFCRTLALRAVASVQSYLARTAAGPAWPEARSVMCAPVATAGGEPLGAIQLDTQDRDRRFTAEDLDVLAIVANLAAVTIEKARMHEVIVAREKEKRDIKLAREVLLGFLPQRLPDVAGYEFYAHYAPAETVGGDYYDFVALPGGRVAVVLADVAGHGMAAALLVARLSSEVQACLRAEPDLARAVRRLNRQMIGGGGMQDRFVTLVVLAIDLASDTLAVVNAGHPSPRLYRGDAGTFEDVISIDESGPALGLELDYEYEAVRVRLRPHDTVTAFTDGVTDAMNAAGQRFGPEAVERHLTPDPTQGPFAPRPRWVGTRLVNAVARHTGSRVQTDDIAVVCFGPWESVSDQSTGML